MTYNMDFAEIELRILAILNDPNYVYEDIHKATARLMFDIPDYEVTKEHLRIAKIVNFRTLYSG